MAKRFAKDAFERRDQIIFGKFEPDKYDCGSRPFYALAARQLRRLLNQSFINPLEKEEISRALLVYQFMKRYPDYTAHGSVSLSDPKDIVIEGISKAKPPASKAELMSFMVLTGDADRVEIGGKMYCEFEEVVPF